MMRPIAPATICSPQPSYLNRMHHGSTPDQKSALLLLSSRHLFHLLLTGLSLFLKEGIVSKGV